MTLGAMWLQASGAGDGRFQVCGDTSALPAGGGRLAVRRADDGAWLAAEDRWQPERPHLFPFRRVPDADDPLLIEVAAAAVRALQDAGEPLTARLRFAASAGREAVELDLPLRIAATGPAHLPAPASAAQSAPAPPAAPVIPPAAAPTPKPASHPGLAGPGESAVLSASHRPASADDDSEDSLPLAVPVTSKPPAAATPPADHWPVPVDAEDDDNSDDTLPLAVPVMAKPPMVTASAEADGGLATRLTVAPGPLAIIPVPDWTVEPLGDQAPPPRGRRWQRLALIGAAPLLIGGIAIALWVGTGGEPTPPPPEKSHGMALYKDVTARPLPPTERYRIAEQADAAGDCEAALRLFMDAARKDPRLAAQLAGRYDPTGFAPSPCFKTASADSAWAWYQNAAEAGDAVAQRRLAQLMLADGRPGEAQSWLRKAADQGDPEARRLLDELPAQ